MPPAQARAAKACSPEWGKPAKLARCAEGCLASELPPITSGPRACTVTRSAGDRPHGRVHSVRNIPAVRLLPKRWRRPCSPSAPARRSDRRPSPTSSICPAPKASYGAVCRRSANRAFYLHGADGNASLELRAGYILQWAIVRWLKERSLCRWYDLNGAMSSPGVRQFKRGLVGARAREIAVTDYDACESPLAALVIRSGRQWNERFRRFWPRPKRINR